MERSQSCSNFEASRVAQLQQEQQQPQLQRQHAAVEPQHAGSSDNLAASHAHFAPNKPLRSKRRKQLQRQNSVLLDDDDAAAQAALGHESAYAADLEENGDVEEQELLRLPKSYRLQQQHQQHLQQQLQQQQHPQRHISSSSTGSTGSSRCLRHEESFDSCSTPLELSPQAVRQHRFSSLLLRDSSMSMQSDSSSRYSSVDSLLESRKPDPEAILINLGFGPVGTEDMLSRIPRRFLKPSKVQGIDTEAFVKRLQQASSLADSSALGYRGLTSSSDQPPSSIVAKIMQRFEVNNQRKKSMGNIEHTIR